MFGLMIAQCVLVCGMRGQELAQCIQSMLAMR
jgi:hypothetical protein